MADREIPRTLHDRLFKEFLHRFLPEFMHLFFPAEAARLDFHTLRFLEQELVFNLPGQTLRITDVVAEVETRSGEAEVVLVHVEVEAGRKGTLSQRMLEYYVLLRLLRHKRVLPIALVLLPNAGGLGWNRYTEELFGHTLLDFHHAQVGLRDLSSEAYLALDDPVAAALAALMTPQQTEPARVKLAAWRTVQQSGLGEGDKLFLMNLVQTYLPQEALANAEEAVMQELAELETTWLDGPQGREEGREEGREGGVKGREEGELRGKRDLLLHL